MVPSAVIVPELEEEEEAAEEDGVLEDGVLCVEELEEVPVLVEVAVLEVPVSEETEVLPPSLLIVDVSTSLLGLVTSETADSLVSGSLKNDDKNDRNSLLLQLLNVNVSIANRLSLCDFFITTLPQEVHQYTMHT